MDEKIPKMGSVVGILGHLASKHSQDIRAALMKLFQVFIVPDKSWYLVNTFLISPQKHMLWVHIRSTFVGHFKLVPTTYAFMEK